MAVEEPGSCGAHMHFALAAIFGFAILTLWVPAEWPVAVFEIAIFILATMVLWATKGRLFFFGFGWWPLIPLVVTCLTGFFQYFARQTAYPFATASATVRWTAFLATFIVGTQLFRSPSVRDWSRSAMVWFAFAVSAVAIVQAVTSEGRVFWLFPTEAGDSPMGPILSRNHYAAFIEAVLPICLWEALRGKRHSLLYSVMASVMFASVIVSASRAGTILAGAEILVVIGVMLVSRRTGRRAICITVVQLAILLIAFAAVAGPSGVLSRFRNGDPLVIRRELNISSQHMITAHPWLGVGLGVWPVVYPGYAVIDAGAFVNEAHNDWLQWVVEGGIPLGILLSTLFLWSVRPAFRSIWGLGVVAVFLHAWVDYPFSRPALGAWPILILAMLAARRPEEPTDENSTVPAEI